MARPWTDEEDTILREHYGKKTRQQLLPLLPGRTIPSVAGRLVKLGIQDEKEPCWSEEETTHLRDRYLRDTWEAIGKHLGRSPASVKLKAKRIGLRRKQRKTLTPSQIGDTMNLCSKQVKRWIRKGWLKARRGPVGKLKMHLVETPDLIECLKAHPELWDARRCPDLHIKLGLTTKRGEAALNDRPLWLKEKLMDDNRKGRKAARWTRAEDVQLAQHIKRGLTYPKIGALLGRPGDAVSHRIHRLGPKLWTLLAPIPTSPRQATG